MPCRDWSVEEDDRREMVEKVDKLTRLLCIACNELVEVTNEQELEKPYPANKELRAWWEKHKKDDAARKQREKEERKREIAQTERELEAATRKLRKLKGTI